MQAKELAVDDQVMIDRKDFLGLQIENCNLTLEVLNLKAVIVKARREDLENSLGDSPRLEGASSPSDEEAADG